MPSRQIAIVTDASGNPSLSLDMPKPRIEPEQMLVKVETVALNPVDVKLLGPMSSGAGMVVGCDFAGTVAALGSMVTRFKVGDRVAGVVPGSNPVAPHIGAFAEYCVAYEDFAWKLHDETTFEEAATLGISITVAGYALFYSMGIPGHPEKPIKHSTMPYVLVYGGSSSSGTMAIQLVRKAGLIPITTCSSKNFGLVQSFGAERAFDYRDPESAEKIRQYTANALYYTLDCFCDKASMSFCYASIGRAGGKYTTLEPFDLEIAGTRKAIRADWLMNTSILGRTVGWKEPYGVKPVPELYSFGQEWSGCIQRMLNKREIKFHPVKAAEEPGLEGILDGIDLIKNHAVSGKKLVYRVARIDGELYK